MIKKIGYLILIQAFSSLAFAQMKCADFFSTESISQQEPKLASGLKKNLMSIVLEEEIKNFIANEMGQLTSAQRDDLRSKAQRFEKELERIQWRIDLYKKMTGSKRLRIVDENVVAAHTEMNLLILGSFDEVYEYLQRDFSKFEVNYLNLLSLKAEILKMNSEGHYNVNVLKQKIAELQKAEIDLGEDYFTYVEVRKGIEELLNGDNVENKNLASQMLAQLQDFAKMSATKYIIDYRPITIEEIVKYRNSNPNALRASYKKAAVREFITMLKMVTLSGPIVAAVKFVIFKLPENISLFGMTDVPLRRIIGDTFGISEKQHLRDLYIGSMNAIIRQNGHPAKQWQLLKDSNALSPRSDEFLVIFARVPENQKIWVEIKAYAKEISTLDAFALDFYERMEAAEKLAIAAKELPLHQREAGATILGRVAVTSIVTYYGLQKYFSDHPKDFGSSVDYLHSFLSFFTN